MAEPMIFADALLARRIEAAETANSRECACGPCADALEIAGGCAIFAGAESPLSQAVGIGLNGAVTPAEVAALEEFFHRRETRVSIDLCPLADGGLVRMLAERGYTCAEFNNVLVRRLPCSEMGPAPNARAARPEERDTWSDTVGRGFFEQPQLTDEEMNVGRAIFTMPGSVCYLGLDSGQPAAAAALTIRSGLATLFADSTLPGFRRRGLHRQLIMARLADAMAHNCDLATASTLPGSGSQRNYQRLGFQVVYTKVTLVREF